MSLKMGITTVRLQDDIEQEVEAIAEKVTSLERVGDQASFG